MKEGKQAGNQAKRGRKVNEGRESKEAREERKKGKQGNEEGRKWSSSTDEMGNPLACIIFCVLRFYSQFSDVAHVLFSPICTYFFLFLVFGLGVK